jgi:hypothetical protein
VSSDIDRINASYARYCLGAALDDVIEMAGPTESPMNELVVRIPPMPGDLEANWSVPTWARLRIVETGQGDLPT